MVGTVSAIVRIHGSRIQGGEIEMVLLTVTPGDLLDDLSAIVVVKPQHLSLSNKCVCVHFISSVPLENHD